MQYGRIKLLCSACHMSILSVNLLNMLLIA